MSEKKEIVHVDAELIPKNDSETKDSDERAISRRRVLEAGAAVLGLFMLPKLAFGKPSGWVSPPDYYGWPDAANGSVVANGGNKITTRSHFNYWNVGNEGDNDPQWIGYAFALTVKSIFTNELYNIICTYVMANCGDFNNLYNWNLRRYSRLWYSKYKDNRLKFWVDGSCKIDEHGMAFTNEPPICNYGSGGWYMSGFRDYGYSSPVFLYRKEKNETSHWFGLEFGIYNVMKDGVSGSRYTWDNLYINPKTSDNCPGDIQAKNDRIVLDQDMSLYGKIVAIVPDAVKSGNECVDVANGGQTSGTGVHLWGASGTGARYTMRNFIMGLGAMDERGGITFYIYPAHVKGFKLVLNAYGGSNELVNAARNRRAPSSTQSLYLSQDDNSTACRFWVTKSVDQNGRYNIISDASGFALDRADGGTGNGVAVRLHSDGINGSEWTNEAHKWRIEEVFFKGTISLDADRVEPGKAISVLDPSTTCTPYDYYSTGSVKYLYRWYWFDKAQDTVFEKNKYTEAFKLFSWCHLAECGDQIWRDAYAGAGYPVKDTNFYVEAFKLKMNYDGSDVSGDSDFGSICYAGCTGISGSGDFTWSDVCRDGEMLGATSVSNRLTGIKIWLEGDIAEEYDLAYRAFIYGKGWTQRYHSNGGSQEDAELCGADGDAGALKCIQVFAIPKPRGAKLVREFAEDNSFIPAAEHSGGYITSQAMLALNLDDTSGFDGHKMITDAYQGNPEEGLNALPVPPTPPPQIGIKVWYYVDGEDKPCFDEDYEIGTTYQVNPDAVSAGQKENCLDLVCWYIDPEYTQPYEPTELDTSLKLYGYNPCSVKYDTTTRSSVLDTSYNWSTDSSMATALDLTALYPQDEVVKYGTKLTFAGPWSAWCEDAGKTRCVTSTPGIYATADASGSPITSATIKGNTTVYVDWPWSGYDGVMSARS